MRQLGVIRDKQAFSAAEVAREEYLFCGPSPGMFLFIPCLSAITPNNFFEFNKTQTCKKHNLTLRTYQPRGNIEEYLFCGPSPGMFLFIPCLSAITPNNFFEFNKTQTRKKHNLTLRTYQPRGNIDKFAFVQRSIPEWNTLYQTLLFKPTRRSSSGSCSRNTYSKTRCLH